MPVYIRTSAELLAHLHAFSSATSVAVDTEFHPEKAYYPRLMLVQLRPEGGESYLVDPLAGVDLRPLGEALAGTTLLVHGGAADLALLAAHAGLKPARVVDSQLAAAFCGLGWPRRLQDLVSLVLGRSLDKQETLSDWSRRPLSADQLRYAADDVELLHELVAALQARVEALGNLAWFEAAQAEATAAALAEPDASLAWQRVPGAHLLGDAERGALQALAAWRLRRAMQGDLPINHVVADAVLFDLARRRPTTLEGLRENRRMPSGLWRQHGEVLLSLLHGAARAEPPPALPRGPRVDALRLAARLAGAARGLDGDLLLTESELKYACNEGTSGSWRREALGPEFDNFVGRRAMISADGVLVGARP